MAVPETYARNVNQTIRMSAGYWLSTGGTGKLMLLRGLTLPRSSLKQAQSKARALCQTGFFFSQFNIMHAQLEGCFSSKVLLTTMWPLPRAAAPAHPRMPYGAFIPLPHGIPSVPCLYRCFLALICQTQPAHGQWLCQTHGRNGKVIIL